MTPAQRDLLIFGRDSQAAAQLLHSQSYYGFAASRAYYTMFYVAEALLLDHDLSFSKHSEVIAAFGQYFAKTGRVSTKFHRYLIRGMEVRHSGDYGGGSPVTEEESSEQLSRAEEFLHLGQQILGPILP